MSQEVKRNKCLDGVWSLCVGQDIYAADGSIDSCYDINTGLKQYLLLTASALDCASDPSPIIIR